MARPSEVQNSAPGHAGCAFLVSTKKLIINADDFGLTEGVNRGVIEAHRWGTVSSTTLMVTGPAALQAAALAKENAGLGVGLHLNLTSGKPALPAGKVPSLVGTDGRLPGVAGALLRLSGGWARTRELEAEIAAQIEECLKMGIVPTHIDSHHHLHAHPRLRRVIGRLCPRLGINRMRGYRLRPRSLEGLAVRAAAGIPVAGAPLKTPDCFFGIEVMEGRDFREPLRRRLSECAGVLEFMCHPGYVDEGLGRASSYSGPRANELDMLLGPAFRQMIDESGARLISYRDL